PRSVRKACRPWPFSTTPAAISSCCTKAERLSAGRHSPIVDQGRVLIKAASALPETDPLGEPDRGMVRLVDGAALRDVGTGPVGPGKNRLDGFPRKAPAVA